MQLISCSKLANVLFIRIYRVTHYLIPLSLSAFEYLAALSRCSE